MKKWIKFVIRVCLGLFLILTAILKLVSIDEFDVYIYSFGFFNLSIVSLLSRLLIAAEMILGIFFITKIWYKTAWFLTILMMGGFSLFLVYAAIFRGEESCHCLGSLIEAKPLVSIIKNIGFIGFMIFIKNPDNKLNINKIKLQKTLPYIIICSVLLAIFIFQAPDMIYNKIYSENKQIDESIFYQLIEDSVYQDLKTDSGKYVMPFYIVGCKYCKLSAKKLQEILTINNISPSHVKIMMANCSNQELLNVFKVETKTNNFLFYNIPLMAALKITNGSFPTFIFIENGKIIKVLDLRGITETEITTFFN